MTLANPDPRWLGMGAVPLPPDYRDFQLANEPRTRMVMAAGIPDSASLQQFKIGPAISQGQLPSCVAHSSAHMEMLYESMERQRWPAMDAVRMYKENGGTGSNGVDSRLVLQYMQDQGVPTTDGAARYKIKSYAFVDFSAGQFAIDTLKAAIAAGRPCVLALLLPSDFTNGMTAGMGAITSGYHQVTPCFYGNGRIGYLNSWGESFGEHGFGSVPESYLLQPGQKGYVYAFTTFDAADDGVTPPPVPTPIPTPTPTPDPANWPREVIRLVNAHRQSIGVPALAEHPALMRSADAKSRDMGTQNYFEHEHNGKGPQDWMREAGITNPTVWGENIAAGQPDPSGGPASATTSLGTLPMKQRLRTPDRSPTGAFTAWLNSPGHRANIEFRGFTHIGVGFAQIAGSQYGTYWTQHFAALGDTPTPTPTPIPDPIPTPTPTPTPVDLRVDSIVGTRTAAASAPGETFRVSGQGFGAGVVQARIGLQACSSTVQSDSVLVVTASATPGCGPLFVRREGAEVQGPTVVVLEGGSPTPTPTPDPTPTPTPDPTPVPPPVGDLVIATAVQRLAASRLILTVVVSYQGQPAAALVTASLGTQLLGQHRTGAGGKTTFIISGSGAVTLDAQDGMGHTGSATVTV